MVDAEIAAQPLIPRRLLFGNAPRLGPKLSPDATHLSWLAPVDGCMNIWVAPVDDVAAGAPVTRLKGRPPLFHDWSYDGRHIFFLQDENGDENYHLFVIAREGGATRDLTPFPRVVPQVYLWSPEKPGSVYVGLNDRDARWHDVYQIDFATGQRTLLYENRGEYGGFHLDWQGRLRLATRSIPNGGGTQVFRFGADTAEDPTPWMGIPFEDSLSTWPLLFNRAATHLHLLSSIGRDTSALLRIDMSDGHETLVAQHETADLLRPLFDPRTMEVMAIAADPVRQEWTVIDEAARPSLDIVRNRFPNSKLEFNPNRENTHWLITAHGPQQPIEYHLLERESGTVQPLFSSRPDLRPFALAPMQAAVLRSRDGLDLPSYVTLPVTVAGDRPAQPLPMVLVVHGGPWGRDEYGYRRDHQWLANRGYAVMSVNYRASTGFGKAFVNAGDKEHAAKMHDDLLDAVAWAIREGIADPARVAIMGYSYGGYASYVAATFTPDVFACTIPIVGITDLVTLMENRPPYWADFMEQFNRRYADVRTEEGRAFLRARSPLYKVDLISKPMLIGHGANDVRCTLAQSDLIVDAMQKKNLPVTYVVFPNEGHGFARPENNIAFNAIVEAFLARHLGGRAEPVGTDFIGSSHVVRAGADILGELGVGPSASAGV